MSLKYYLWVSQVQLMFLSNATPAAHVNLGYEKNSTAHAALVILMYKKNRTAQAARINTEYKKN